MSQTKEQRKSLARALKFIEGLERFDDKDYERDELAKAYRQVFADRMGQLVLWDILTHSRIFSGFNPGLDNADARAHHENGQRTVGYHILSALGYEVKEEQPTKTVNRKPE